MSTFQKLSGSFFLAYVLNKYQPRYSPGFLTGAILIFLVQFVVLAFYNVVIYPRFISPLRNLPKPPDGGFITGQTRRILRDPSGVPMKDWVANVKNNGLIYYSVWLQGRVMPTTPAALGRSLVANVQIRNDF